MRAGHPAETAEQLVGRMGLQLLGVSGPIERCEGLTAMSRSTSRFTVRANSSPGVTCSTSLTVPPWRAVAGIVRGDLVLHQRGVPLVRQDRRPQQPEPLRRVDEHRGVRVRVAWRVGHHERLAPAAAALLQPRAANEDVVGRALSGSVEPAGQQVAARQFDDHRRVVVPVLEREDQLGGQERRDPDLAPTHPSLNRGSQEGDGQKDQRCACGSRPLRCNLVDARWPVRCTRRPMSLSHPPVAGLFAAVVTPTHEDGQVDLADVRSHCRLPARGGRLRHLHWRRHRRVSAFRDRRSDDRDRAGGAARSPASRAARRHRRAVDSPRHRARMRVDGRRRPGAAAADADVLPIRPAGPRGILPPT